MASFASELEQSLHRALRSANERRHEFATLEHLLLALCDDNDARSVLRACNVEIDQLREQLNNYLEEDLASLTIEEEEEAKPTAGFQRVIQRAVYHVQSWSRAPTYWSPYSPNGKVTRSISCRSRT